MTLILRVGDSEVIERGLSQAEVNRLITTCSGLMLCGRITATRVLITVTD